MRLTLPLDVLAQLERMSNSAFVHAFLIRHIADSAAGNHRLSLCAREFISARLTDFGKLRGNLPDATAIIEALRTAELSQQLTAQVLESAPTFREVVARLRTDTSSATLDASAEVFTKARNACRDGSALCKTIARALEQMDTLRRARSASTAARELAQQAAVQVANAAKATTDASSALDKESSLVAQLKDAVSRADSATPADTAALTEAQPRAARWSSVTDSLETIEQAVSRAATEAGNKWKLTESATVAAQATLNATLGTLDTQLSTAPEKMVSNITVAMQGIKVGGTRVIGVATAPLQTAALNPTARPANLMLAMTDFIIARARQEAVNSFIVNLHILAQNEPLVRMAFTDTWGLMQSLPTRSDLRLNAVDVGRVPLNVWRATLAGDFVMAPVRLLDSEPGALCYRRRSPADKTAPAIAAYEEICRRRVAALRPLGPIARRLLAGDAVFDILRDVNSYAPLQGPDAKPSWRRLTQGLRFLGALAETFVIQGLVQAPDVTRNPYLLTSQALTQVPQQQRSAFLRLLLVQAIPSKGDISLDTDEAALSNATGGMVRILERLGSRSTSSEPTALNAALVVHDAFESLVSAADVARMLTTQPAAMELDTLKTRWRAVSGMIEPIVAHDFGLALSRSTVLLRELRGRDLPRPFITFTTLASSLSEAQTAEQVRSAFETAASPVGGWQAKRYGEGGGSITAFPGIAVGVEKVIRKKRDNPSLGRRALAAGVSLPVGVEWQRRLVDKEGIGASDCHVYVCGVGLFVPVVDLGALLSYRFGGSDAVESEPNATVRQVFAPGLYLSFALTRTVPANLLIGAQLMPALRKVTEAGEGTVNRSAVRFGVGLGMDVMLFDF